MDYKDRQRKQHQRRCPHNLRLFLENPFRILRSLVNNICTTLKYDLGLCRRNMCHHLGVSAPDTSRPSNTGNLHSVTIFQVAPHHPAYPSSRISYDDDGDGESAVDHPNRLIFHQPWGDADTYFVSRCLLQRRLGLPNDWTI